MDLSPPMQRVKNDFFTTKSTAGSRTKAKDEGRTNPLRRSQPHAASRVDGDVTVFALQLSAACVVSLSLPAWVAASFSPMYVV